MADFMKVTHRVTAFLPDGPDAGYDPDPTLVQGSVSLVPVGTVTMVVDDVTAVGVPVDAPIIDGVLMWRGAPSIRLLAGVRWRATWSIKVGSTPLRLPTTTFMAEPDSALDLSEVLNG
ncbi:hypothetical protein [Corynebacterium variabile]|uniref:hypothetical protein n=1 Tax=Corynebacterium variabile TaxID=1727 RepID=UPI00264784E1|nr:hypothetical protein [Corynebacterium variabile]MDN6677758.1 hypothetical protein [Corynebacterium variabile]